MKLYKYLASEFENYRLLATNYGNSSLEERKAREFSQRAVLNYIIDCHFPSGSGIDNGTKLDLDSSRTNRIVLTCDFHHMDDVGQYRNWTNHSIVYTPSLVNEIDILVKGKNQDLIKEHLYEIYRQCLLEDIPTSLPQEMINMRERGYLSSKDKDIDYINRLNNTFPNLIF